MKKARLVIAMVIVAMMTSIFSIASAETTVAVTATKGNVGDVVTVTFTLPANSGVYAFDMDVVYDKEELEFVSAKKGPDSGMGELKKGDTVGIVEGNSEKVENGDYVMMTADFKVIKAGAKVTGKINEATDAEANILEAGAVVVGEVVIEAPATEAPTTTAPATAVPTTGDSTTTVPTTVETKAEVDDNPNTGVVACTAAVVALAASGVVLVKSKRK